MTTKTSPARASYRAALAAVDAADDAAAAAEVKS